MNTIQDELHEAARLVRDARIGEPPPFAVVKRSAQRRNRASVLALITIVAIVCGLVAWRARGSESSTLDIVDDPSGRTTLTRTRIGNSGWELLWLPDGYRIESTNDDEIVAKAGETTLRITLVEGTANGTPLVQWPLSDTIETSDGAQRREANTMITLHAPALSLPDRLRVVHSVAPTERANPITTTAVSVTVPDLRTIDYLDATQRLVTSGLRVRWLVAAGDSAAVGSVVDQMPPAGEQVSGGSVVAIAVAAPSLPDVRQRLREDGYIGVAGNEDVFDNRSYPAGFAAATHTLARVDGGQQSAIVPVVFLRGELVGYFGFGGGFAPLDKLTDPAWKPTESPPQTVVDGTGLSPTSTVAAGEATVVEYRGLRIEMPPGWRLGDCPGDRTVVLDPRPLPCPSVEGTWLTMTALDPGAPEIFDCFPGFFDDLEACQVLRTTLGRNGRVAEEDRYAKGFDARITYHYGGSGGSNDRPIVVDPKVSRDRLHIGESPQPAISTWAEQQRLELLDVRGGQYQSYALTRLPGGTATTAYELTMSFVFSPRTRSGEWRVTAQKRFDEPWPPSALAPRR